MTPTKVETDTYSALINKIVESDIDDDFLKDFPSVQLPGNGNSQTQAFPPELEAALEDDIQAAQYISNLKKRIEAWKATGLTDAMQRAMELLNEDGLSSGKAGEDDDDTDGRLVQIFHDLAF